MFCAVAPTTQVPAPSDDSKRRRRRARPLVGSGNALHLVDPGRILISFSLVGIIVFCVMHSLGGVASWIPVTGSFTGYASRFIDDSLSFVLGWSYWYLWVTVLANGYREPRWWSWTGRKWFLNRPGYWSPGSCFWVSAWLAFWHMERSNSRFSYWFRSARSLQYVLQFVDWLSFRASEIITVLPGEPQAFSNSV